ncbi:hypothetical protein [Priestia aryabhattai]
MWDEVLDYFYIEQESEYITCFRLKENYASAIKENYRFLLIENTDEFSVYNSFSDKNSSLIISKNSFNNKEEAELYIRYEAGEVVRKNLIYFVFGK